MLKYVMLSVAVFAISCSKRTDEATVTGVDGKDGTSCSVAPEYVTEVESLSSVPIGAKISCTDGSFAVILNGEKGDQGVQGPQGNQGVQGPQGQAGASCQTFKKKSHNGVFLQCPGQEAVLISNGKDGSSCSTVREKRKDRVRITCGKTVSYVYDGKDGENGSSCVVEETAGGAIVTCGDSKTFLANGKDGVDGLDGEDAVKPGMLCNVHDLSNWNGISSILNALTQTPPAGNFVLANLNVGDSPSANGFPGMPQSIQNTVGLTGYTLDCTGYLNIQTSGLYEFSMLGDDGIRLVIDNQVIINAPQLQAPTTHVSKTVELQKGHRSINVIYYQGPHTQIALRLRYQGVHTPLQVVPASLLRH